MNKQARKAIKATIASAVQFCKDRELKRISLPANYEHWLGYVVIAQHRIGGSDRELMFRHDVDRAKVQSMIRECGIRLADIIHEKRLFNPEWNLMHKLHEETAMLEKELEAMGISGSLRFNGIDQTGMQVPCLGWLDGTKGWVTAAVTGPFILK